MLCCVAAASAALSVVPAAAEPVPTAVVSVVAFAYTPGDVTMPELPLQMIEGTGLEFAPLDTLGNHSVVSITWVDGAPLFESPLIGPGQVAPVAGVEKLAPGSYAFTCNVHEFMLGTLEVLAR